jgi:hypothetical protein
MRYIRVKDAERNLPAGWNEQPNISKTGSVRGMQNRFGWKRGHAFRIGSYIYHFSGGECYYSAKRIARS